MAKLSAHPRAWVAVTLVGLYSAAQALCAIFVSVYLWVNSADFGVVCQHYLALYTVTPFFFVLAGWYSSVHERLNAYRAGLVLHAVYYAAMLTLRERSTAYAPHLGALLGVTWGIYFAGANTFQFDVTEPGKRERFLGVFRAVGGTSRLLAPLLGGAIVRWAPDSLAGYHRLFALSIVLYTLCFILSFWMTPDDKNRPYRIRRALFPGRDQPDWRWLLLASISLGGTFNIFGFLLGLLMYMETGDALSVGAFASVQALLGILASLVVGHSVRPSNRRLFLIWGTVLLVAAGAMISLKLTVVTLILFGLMRAVAGTMFGIPHASLRLDTIARYAHEPADRIAYLSAWEVPLAIGRITMMLMMIGLYSWLRGSEAGLRITLFVLCAIRIITLFILLRVSELKRDAAHTAAADSAG